MKIFKIFLLLLVSAMTFVGCRKSNVRPADSPVNSTYQSNPEMSNNVVARSGDVEEAPDPGLDPVNVVVSGDGDRDGGDKRQKKR